MITLVDIFIRSGDIRDRSVKLRKIAPNFGRFLPSHMLRRGRGGASPPKIVPT